MFTRIVVGADGSSQGRDAVVLGARIAAATGAGLTLLSTFPVSLFPSPGYSDRRTNMRHSEHQLAVDRELYAPDALVHVAADSSPARALRHHAEEWNADLVIVGSAEGTPAGHTAISHTGRELLANAPFALGIAQTGLHAHDFDLRTVGVGYDGGPESEIALAFAAGIAEGSGAALKAVTVLEEDDAGAGGQSTAAAKLPPGCELETLTGEPKTHLQDASDGYDLLVIGSRRWGTLARVVLGGVGETLVGGAGCSLLVTPAVGESHAETGAEQRDPHETAL